MKDNVREKYLGSFGTISSWIPSKRLIAMRSVTGLYIVYKKNKLIPKIVRYLQLSIRFFPAWLAGVQMEKLK